MILVLFLPFSVKRVEEQLEAFLLMMGLSAATVSGVWSGHLVHEAFREPLLISLAVLIIGFFFRASRDYIRTYTGKFVKLVGLPVAIFTIVFMLGILSSVITAIIAALVLTEVVSALNLDRKYEVRLVIYACFAIGLGAALTPLGEPLSTIVVSKLRAAPHNADFFYLLKKIGVWVVPGVFFMSLLASMNHGDAVKRSGLRTSERESVKDIILRAGKVYIFVMALVFLGAGLRPLAEATIVSLPEWQLFWLNSLSAVLDNATLAAAEIVPTMSDGKITYILMGLLISGGMLIPGNIPNIISASKLNIKSREWASVALPLGAVVMLVYFVFMMLVVTV